MLTREQKIEIFVMRTDGYTMQEIADKFGMTKENVRLVINGLLDRKPVNTGNGRMYPAIRRALRRKGMSVYELSRSTGICVATLYRAVRPNENPNKKTIDAILAATGLTYEEAFGEEANDG